MSYNARALLPPGCTISTMELQALLQKKFVNLTNVSVSIGQWNIDDKLYVGVQVDTWQIRVTYSDEPSVVIESREIATYFAQDRDDKDVIASCDSRIEIDSDDDPNMDYFNDYVFVLEALETIEGAILIDTNSWKFM